MVTKKSKIVAAIKKVAGVVGRKGVKSGSSQDPLPKTGLRSGTRKKAKSIGKGESPSGPEKLSGAPMRSFTSETFPKHGQTQAVAFLRDPSCLYVYWEVAEESLEAVKKQLAGEYSQSARVLRIFRTGEGAPKLVQEIEVGTGEMSRYVELQEWAGDLFAEVGQRTASGRYVAYARSNPVSNPDLAGPGPASAEDLPMDSPAGIQKYYEGLDLMEPFSTGISSAQSGKGKRAGYFASRI